VVVVGEGEGVIFPPHLCPLPRGERKREEIIPPHLCPLPRGERSKNRNRIK